MKKIIAFILTLIFLMSAVQIPAMAEETTSAINNEKMSVLTTLGIVEPLLDESLAVTPVTRAEFALYVGNIIGVTEKNICDKRYYTDLPADHWAANTINTLTQMGVVGGSDGKFNPGDVISRDEAITMLLNALGYKEIAGLKGGFPIGYRILANQFDIASRMGALEELTFIETCEILYDTLFAPIVRVNNYTSDGEETYHTGDETTVMDYYFKVKHVRGILKSAFGISVDTGSACEVHQVRIDNVVFKNECADAVEYLGRQVSAYYRDTKDGKTVFMIFLTGNDDSIIIDVEDFEGFNPSTNEVSYFDGKTERKISISAGSTVVRNGENYSNRVRQAFENLRKGQIFLSKSERGVYDIAIIKNYTDMVVMSINSEKMKIYDKIDNTNVLSLDDVEYLKIYDDKRNEKIFDDIAEDAVLSVCKSANYCEIIISNSTVTGEIATIQKENGKTKLKINNILYPIADEYYTTNMRNIAAGDNVTAYIDAFGVCVYLDDSVKTPFEAGYIVATTARENFGSYRMKILRQSGALQVFECSKKVLIDGVAKKTDAEIEAALSARSGRISKQVIRFALDSDNKIKWMETAVPYGQTPADNNVLRAETAREQMYYYAGSGMLGPKVKLIDSTICFVVPDPTKMNPQDKEFAVMARTDIMGSTNYRATAYKTNDATIAADIVLFETDNLAQGDWYHHLVLVDSVYQVYDTEEEESVQAADVWINGVKYTYYAAEGRTFDAMPARWDAANRGPNNIQSGDVLRIFKNSLGEITEADVVWSYATQAPSQLNSGWVDWELYITYGYITSIKDGLAKFEYKENGQNIAGIATCESSIMVYDSQARRAEKIRLGNQMDLYEAMMEHNLIVVPQRYGATNTIIILK